MSEIEQRHARNLLILSRAAGIFNIAIGSVSLSAWYFGWNKIVGLSSYQPAVAPNTALALLLIGLHLLVWPPSRGLSRALKFGIGLVLVVIGVASIIEFFSPGTALWPNHLLSDFFGGLRAVPEAKSIRIPAPDTGICFTLFGIALVVSEIHYYLAQWLLVFSQFVPIIALLTLAFRDPHASAPMPGMATQTSLALIAAALGFLAKNPEKSLLRRLHTKGASSEVARFLGLAALSVPLLFGITSYVLESVPAANQVFVYMGLVLAIVAVFLAATAFAVRALDQSEESFRGLVESSHDPILLIDGRGRIEFANRQVSGTFGYDPREIIGQPVELLIPEHPGQRRLWNGGRLHKKIEAHKINASHEFRARRKNGTELPVDISLTPTRLGTRPTVTLVVRDISERKKEEERQRYLAESARVLTETLDYQGRLQKISELAVSFLADTCVVTVEDEDGFKVRAASHKNPALTPALAEMAQLYPQLGVGSSCELPFGQHEYIGEDAQTAIKNGVALNADHFERLRRIELKSQLCVPLTARSKIIGWLSLGITDSNRQFSPQDTDFIELVAHRFAQAADNARLYEEAQNAIRNREDILSVVSHDLKNPLAVIDLSVGLLNRRVAGFPNAESIIDISERIRKASEQMRHLVLRLLSYGKMQSGTFTIQPSHVRLADFFGNLEGIFGPLANKSGIHLVFSGDSSLEFDADESALFQAVSNLIGNALKFTARAGKVEVRGHSGGQGDLRIEVQDNGCGIPDEIKPKIFERYWKADKSSGEGTGLGLYIVKGVAQAHKGKVYVDSEPGKGTRFTLQIPLHPAQESYDPNEFHRVAG